MTTRLTGQSPAQIDTDAVVVAVAADSDGLRIAPGAEPVEAAFDGRLTAALEALGARGEPDEISKIPTFGALRAPLVVATGLGRVVEGSFDLEALRRATGAALRALAGRRRVALALPARTVAETEAVVLGALLGNYAYTRYRRDGDSPVAELVVTGAPVEAEPALRRAETLAAAVTLVRDLVNTPPCDLRPPAFAELAEAMATQAGLDVEVLDEKALREGGYGGLLGVGQGSDSPPRLVRLAYRHPAAHRTLALVGKGITFDSGGLSLKPTTSMDWMKSDMGGAAAVLGALVAASRLRPQINIVGYLCLAENMPSGTAQRPSDVLTVYGGRTVEVMNTDAEGRLVLADGLVRACEDQPDLVIDVATLTGAQLVALGTRTCGVMANHDDVRDRVVAAAERAGESMWPMPLPEELRRGLDSSVADIANVGPDRFGGMLAAGIFLREFVPAELRWAHLDIAGPAFNRGEPFGYTPKGGTGVATRTLIQVIEDAAAGRL